MLKQNYCNKDNNIEIPYRRKFLWLKVTIICLSDKDYHR